MLWSYQNYEIPLLAANTDEGSLTRTTVASLIEFCNAAACSLALAAVLLLVECLCPMKEKWGGGNSSGSSTSGATGKNHKASSGSQSSSLKI